MPLLGFCLGAQLIGEALGATTERSPNKEVGNFPITLTVEGKKDPLLAHLPEEFLVSHWHNDMPGLMNDSVILASSRGCPRQILRYKHNAYGFQCHPEMTLQCADEMVKNCPGDLTPGKYVQTKEAILTHDYAAHQRKYIFQILDNFLGRLF